MANELDKTIEELEAEVLSELEEANGADAPMKSAGKPDKMDKAEGEVQETGNDTGSERVGPVGRRASCLAPAGRPRLTGSSRGSIRSSGLAPSARHRAPV